jgi:hypothetical protein
LRRKEFVPVYKAVVSLFNKKVSLKTGIEMFLSERTGILSGRSQDDLVIMLERKCDNETLTG